MSRPRLTMLKPRIKVAETSRTGALPIAPRIRGRALQTLRLRVWLLNPCCAMCGRVCPFPDGFELDHKVALHLGGSNADDQHQVLCHGCHARKTAEDQGHEYRPPIKIGPDGYPC